MKRKILSIWLVGLSGSGKTTLGNALMNRLKQNYDNVKLLDGDNMRKGLNKDLGFANNDRLENIRRVAEVNKILLDCGITVINCFICPTKEIINIAKTIIGESNMLLCYMDTPLSVCETRDTKGLYQKARTGEIINFTGINSTYEIPDADIILNTVKYNVVDCIEIILQHLNTHEN